MRGFEGSSEKHVNGQRVTGQGATFGFGMFVEPLTPGTLPLCGPLPFGYSHGWGVAPALQYRSRDVGIPKRGKRQIPHPIKSKLRSGIEPFWGQSSNAGLHLKTGLSPGMEQERRRICHESF